MKYKVNNETDWHALRSTCITASEAAVLVALNPYSSPGKLKKDVGFRGNAYTLVGQVLEPAVVDVTNRVLGTKFKLFEDVDGKVFYVKNNLGATPDATDGIMLLECKSTRPHTFVKYCIEPPMMYLIQLQVQMYCTDLKVGYLAIMSTDLTQSSDVIKWPIVIYKVQRSDAVCDILQEEAARFYSGAPFRARSDYKKRVTLLLSLACEKVFNN